MTSIDRRTLIASGAVFVGASFLPRIGQAQGAPLNLFTHKVMQTVAQGSQGGDITRKWQQDKGVSIQWTTFDTGPLQERLFREAALGETSVDVGFLLNAQAAPKVLDLFEPLDDYLKKDPVEDLPDIFPGLVEGMRVKGTLIGMPFRHASSGLHYNTEFLAEKGFSKGPGSIEELVEMARACTGRRADGQNVVGLVMPGVTYPNVIDLARAWNGDFITQDFKLAVEGEGMMNAVKLLRALFAAGAFPRNFSTMTSEDVNVWMQQGRAAFSLQSMGRNRIYNDPAKSRYPGKIVTVAVPASKTIHGQFDVAPAKVEFWGLVMPKHAKRKDLAWSFIKAMVSKEATLGAALNGNGPVRNSTYDDQRLRANITYADEERRVLKVARVPLPAFDEAARAGDIFKEEVEAAVLGMKTPEAALHAVAERVKPLLPAR
jgi:multiple sugar transport system substrate-binding protein